MSVFTRLRLTMSSTLKGLIIFVIIFSVDLIRNNQLPQAIHAGMLIMFVLVPLTLLVNAKIIADESLNLYQFFTAAIALQQATAKDLKDDELIKNLEYVKKMNEVKK